MYLAYELTDASRHQLLQRFPPIYADILCHHVTYKFPAKRGDALPPIPRSVDVVGYRDSGDGVEALAVSVDGHVTRPDGLTFHVTLSIDRNLGRKPVHSNEILRHGYEPVHPIRIQVVPKLLA